ncbi:hypothetical protein TNCV_3968841 [Trichonephila clavipes]|nr:hypothetical protein TNCV_3968841 [Trichonephila clavipes]
MTQYVPEIWFLGDRTSSRRLTSITRRPVKGHPRDTPIQDDTFLTLTARRMRGGVTLNSEELLAASGSSVSKYTVFRKFNEEYFMPENPGSASHSLQVSDHRTASFHGEYIIFEHRSTGIVFSSLMSRNLNWTRILDLFTCRENQGLNTIPSRSGSKEMLLWSGKFDRNTSFRNTH